MKENTIKKIPWAKPYIAQEEIDEVNDSLQVNWLSQGPKVARLEAIFKELSQREYVIAVSNGTVAIDMALICLSIKQGDEVIIPAHTYFATGASVARMGAVPVFADVEPDTFTIDPTDIRKKISGKTRCIISVDLGGNPCDHIALQNISTEFGIPILSDAAQSLGGEFDGKPLFAYGDITTTSLNTAKTVNTVEGGMIFTDRKEHYDLLIRLRNQGEEPGYKFNHTVLGFNARLSDLHAAIGLGQMKKYERLLQKRIYIAAKYSEALHGIKDIKSVKVREQGKNGWFFFSLLVDRRDELADYLSKNGIETRICYPVPLYKQKAFQGIPYAECPNAEYTCSHIITLPLFYEMTDDEILYVTEKVKSFYW